MATEKVERFVPTLNTLRELYLKSGNRCAHTGCVQALFDKDGAFVGEVCHIEAAKRGGPRFNESQSNEDRRQASNLVLLCRNHHKKTDDEDLYPRDRMWKMKAAHEKIFSDVVGAMLRTVTDYTKLAQPVFPNNLKAITTAEKWSQDEEEANVVLSEMRKLVRRLAKVPQESREFFLVVLERSVRRGSQLQASHPEVKQATRMGDHAIRVCFKILEDHRFVSGEEDEDRVFQIYISPTPEELLDLWPGIKRFCKRKDIPLETLIVELDFSCLDA